MKKRMLLVVALFVCKIVFAQTQTPLLNPTLQNLIPPSPDATAFSKFGSVPVGPSTGIPQINVPVYSYTGGNGLKLSISLDYHAGGIQVDEVASSTGLGWSLNSGGVITRMVRGAPDEMYAMGFMNAGALPTSDLEGNSPVSLDLRQYNQISGGARDGEPDLFGFNFSGRHGNFIYGKNNDLLMINQQPLVIEKVITNIAGQPQITKFIITDEAGFKYEFEAAEITTTLGAVWPIAKTFTSSWYLTKVSTPSGKDNILLEYENKGYQYQVTKGVTEVVRLPGKPIPPNLSGSTSAQSISGKRIKKITFPNGVNADFSYNTTQRTDLPGDYLLQKITVGYAGAKRGVRLEHNYVTNRATLIKVIPFSGLTETEDLPYIFEYNPTALPVRFSSQQDHWGFFNNNQGSFIPREDYKTIMNGQQIYLILQGGSRDTDAELCKAGSLSKITYPTGGYTIFEMEANKAKDDRLSSETITNIYYRDDSKSLPVSSSGSTNTTFTFAGDPNSGTDLKFTVPSVSELPGTTKIFIELRNAANTLIDVFEIDPVSTNGNNEVELSLNKSYFVPGNYTFTTYTQGLSSYNSYINFNWHETRILNPVQIVTGHIQHFVGGLRAKKITDYSTNGTAVNAREFEYLLEDGTSSGTLGVYPVYTYPVYYDHRLLSEGAAPTEMYNGDGLAAPNVLVRSSMSVFFLAHANGSPVTYRRVVERWTNNGEDGGRTERYFTSFGESPIVLDATLPYNPPQYKEWGYGLLRYEKVYDKDNNIIKWQENQYAFSTDTYFLNPVRHENFRGITVLPVKYVIDGVNHDLNNFWGQIVGQACYFLGKSFYPDAGRVDLVKTIDRMHTSPATYIETETNYTYDAANFNLKNENLLDSKGVLIEQKMNYPKDMVTQGKDPNGIYQAMISRNIISPMIEQTEWKAATQLKLSRTNYYSPHTDVYVPRSVEVQSIGGPLDKRLEYHSYNDKGRLLNASRFGDVVSNYIWGYNDQVLIAECKNAAITDCYYNGFEEGEGNSTEGDGKAGKKSRVNGYTRSLTGLTNGKYILTYWSKSGGSWLLIKNNVMVTGGSYTIALSGQVDEVRFHPFAAQMTTYTYDQLFGVTSVSDVNQNTSQYEYDNLGRLKLIRDQDGHIIKQYDYQYQSTTY